SSRAASVKRSASMTRGYALSVVMSSYLITVPPASRHTAEYRHGTRARTPCLPWRPRRPAVKLRGLELSSQRSHHCLGVAEDHAGVGLVEQRVLHTGEARLHGPLEHEGGLGLVYVDDGHAVQRTALVFTRCRVDDVVGPDHHGYVYRVHTRVDVPWLDQLLVCHVGLCQQHVHVARHAAGNRVDGVAHLGAVGLEQVSQRCDDVRGLSDSHAVPGDEHDAARGFENVVGVRWRQGLDLALDSCGACWRDRAEATEQHVGKRAVHRFAHDLGEDQTGGTDQRTRHDEHVVAYDEARSRGSDTRVTIEERDHDRHVGAADGQHGQDTEHQRQRYDDEQDGVGSRRVDDEHDAEDDGSTDDRGIDQLLGGEEYRFACYALGELEPCQYRPADGAAADQDGEEDRDGGDGGGVGVDQVLDPADQQRRETAGAVEQSHGLWHLGHLYPSRKY